VRVACAEAGAPSANVATTAATAAQIFMLFTVFSPTLDNAVDGSNAF
jgi:hypothetical protein